VGLCGERRSRVLFDAIKGYGFCFQILHKRVAYNVVISTITKNLSYNIIIQGIVIITIRLLIKKFIVVLSMRCKIILIGIELALLISLTTGGVVTMYTPSALAAPICPGAQIVGTGPNARCENLPGAGPHPGGPNLGSGSGSSQNNVPPQYCPGTKILKGPEGCPGHVSHGPNQLTCPKGQRVEGTGANEQCVGNPGEPGQTGGSHH
jgi:hypothetical protein